MVLHAMNDDRLGPYRLLRRLGEGGMGVVHLAVDQQGRQVAVKVLRSEVAGDAVARRRLSREVETMRRVRSNHIAEVLDADVTGHRPYIVTRYVAGRSLDEIVRDDGPLELPALLMVAHGVAAALSAVHAVGVVHRDLKPGNVLILDGKPVLIDFGIAQAVDATRLTQTGMFIGTPGYLAPEIIEGQEAGPEVDVHAWAGTILYAGTGLPPFGKGTLEMIFYNITAGKADVAAAPQALQPLLKAAFQRDPGKRPRAAELAEQTIRLMAAPVRTVPDEIATAPVSGPVELPTPPVRQPPAAPSQPYVSLLPGTTSRPQPGAAHPEGSPQSGLPPTGYQGGQHSTGPQPGGAHGTGPQPGGAYGTGPQQGGALAAGAQPGGAYGTGLQQGGQHPAGPQPGGVPQAGGQADLGGQQPGGPYTSGPYPGAQPSSGPYPGGAQPAHPPYPHSAHPPVAPSPAAPSHAGPPAAQAVPPYGGHPQSGPHGPPHSARHDAPHSGSHSAPHGAPYGGSPSGSHSGSGVGGGQYGAPMQAPYGSGPHGGQAAPPYQYGGADDSDRWPTRRVTPEELRRVQDGAQGTPWRGAQSWSQPGGDHEADVPTMRVRPETPPPYIPVQAPPLPLHEGPATRHDPFAPGSPTARSMRPAKAYGVACAMLLIIMIVVGAVAPVVVAAVAIPCAILLRAADLAQAELAARRRAGAAALDVIRVLSDPVALARSAGITLALGLYALILGLPVTLLLAVMTDMAPGNALAWGFSVAIWTVCAGPGVEGPGRQMRRTLSSLVPSKTAATVTAGVCAVAAALSLALAAATFGSDPAVDSVWSPATVRTLTSQLAELDSGG
jgi:serine/threonine protein kinase